jgi:hypothetical protein
LAQTYQATDPEADARLQKEAELEEKTINKICDELGVQIHEVKLESAVTLCSLLIRCLPRLNPMAIASTLQLLINSLFSEFWIRHELITQQRVLQRQTIYSAIRTISFPFFRQMTRRVPEQRIQVS